MTPDAIRAVVQEALGDVAPEARDLDLDAKADLREELDLDSMDFLNVIKGIHERLQVDIPESDYAKVASLDSMVAYLSERLP
jgi:acyl carrier protein